MSRTRSARLGHANHRRFLGDFSGFAAALAAKKWKFTVEQTKAMVIIRTATGDIFGDTITFNQACADLFAWEGKRERNAFSNISEDGLSDMLAETFFQGATVHTAKAEYVLWNPGTTCGLCCEPSEGGETHIECARRENAWADMESAGWNEPHYAEMEYAA